jgi:hypothetical protein
VLQVQLLWQLVKQKDTELQVTIVLVQNGFLVVLLLQEVINFKLMIVLIVKILLMLALLLIQQNV